MTYIDLYDIIHVKSKTRGSGVDLSFSGKYGYKMQNNVFSEKKDNNLGSVITNWISNIYPKKNKKKVLKFLTWDQSAKQLTDVIIKNNWSEKW
jgi:hypothetical protein